MRSSLAAFLVTGLAVLVTGCSQPPAVVENRDADIKAIKDDGEQWKKDFAAKDLDKLMSHYADDFVVINPGGPPLKGKDATRSALKEMLADPAFSLTFDEDKVEVAKSGDLGYAQGAYRMTMTNPATKKPMDDHGTFLEVYKKQTDGAWKSAVDMATSEVLVAPAPAAPAPAKKKK